MATALQREILLTASARFRAREGLMQIPRRGECRTAKDRHATYGRPRI
jgi:hypothetical protein